MRLPLRLGSDSFSKGEFSQKTINEVVAVFEEVHKNLELENVKKVLIAATSAYRCSKNKAELEEAVFKKTKLLINEISGQLEAQLIREAIVEKVSLKPKKYLFFDIGGGSIELSFMLQKSCLSSKSFPLGTVRMMEVIKNKKLKESLREYKKNIRDFLRDYLGKNEPIQVIGTGGNFRYLLKFKKKYIKKDSNSLSLTDIEHIYRVMQDCTQKEMIELFQMRKDRADVILPALEIIRFVFEMIKVTKVRTPDVGLLDGLFSIIDKSELTQTL